MMPLCTCCGNTIPRYRDSYVSDDGPLCLACGMLTVDQVYKMIAALYPDAPVEIRYSGDFYIALIYNHGQPDTYVAESAADLVRQVRRIS